MKKVLSASLLWFSMLVLKAQIVSVEPDNYASGTVLNNVSPFVSLITAGTNNLPHPPVPFDIRATESTFPWQPPTGNNVFSHAGGVTFFNSDRRFRMDFNGLVSFVSIVFQGGNSLQTMRGQLDVFGSDGQLLTTYITQPLLGGQTETMSINRTLSDIAWATAYTVPGDNPFGRLDALFFSTPVPEPGTPALILGLGAAWAWFRRRNGALWG
jgi:hypothetical protein